MVLQPAVAGWHFRHALPIAEVTTRYRQLDLHLMPGYHACYISRDRLSIGTSVPLDHPHAVALAAKLATLGLEPLQD